MTASSHIDKALFAQLAEGDESAFRQIFDAWRNPFYAAAFKVTRSADLAEEVVQEVFVTLWEKRVQIAAANNPKGYLITVLHNHVYSHFRRLMLERQARQNAANDSAVSEAGNPVEELLLAKENRQALHAVISKLPPQQQLVYRLAKQEGLSREEIAKKLDISPNTVRNHLAAAVEFIRQYLKKGASAIIWLIIMEQF